MTLVCSMFGIFGPECRHRRLAIWLNCVFCWNAIQSQNATKASTPHHTKSTFIYERAFQLAVSPELFPIEQPPSLLRLDERYLLVLEITVIYAFMLFFGLHLT